jgi:predicted acetyltransferase
VSAGRSQEGQVYKPVDGVFTVEGAQVHEAHLVLEGDRLVGFYLPVERAFSPSRDDSNLRLPIQRR